MKKFLFGMLAAAALLTASCERSLDGADNATGNGKANVTVNLGLPQMQTRAYSDGTTATNLQYAVYVKDGNTLSKLDSYTKTAETMVNLKYTTTLQLVTGRTYAFVFWASEATAPYTVDFGTNGATMSVDYSGVKANDENLDAFYAYKELEVLGDCQMQAELYRPFAQINVGTNDYAVAATAGYVPTVSHVTLSNVYSTLDLVTGAVSDEDEVEFAYNTIPGTEAGSFPVPSYDYMAMVYALVAAEQELVEVSFDCSTAETGGEVRAEHTVGSVPVQRNYRTNIYGSLLTSQTTIMVEIKPEYEGETNYPLASTVIMESADASEVNRELADVIKNFKDSAATELTVIFPEEGTYSLKAASNAQQLQNWPNGKKLTFIGGSKDVELTDGDWVSGATGYEVELRNLTLKVFENATNHTSLGFIGAAKVTLTDVDVYGELDIKSGEVAITNCNFYYAGGAQGTRPRWGVYFNGPATATIEGCTFDNSCTTNDTVETQGICVTGGWAESNATEVGDLTIKDCVFKVSGGEPAKAAVHLTSDFAKSYGKITITNTTAEGYPALWEEVNNDTANEKTTKYPVVVDGEKMQ